MGFSCDVCYEAKLHRLPFIRSEYYSSHAFDLLHIDLWGPYHITSITSAWFFLTILDCHTCCTWTYLLSHKY